MDFRESLERLRNRARNAGHHISDRVDAVNRGINQEFRTIEEILTDPDAERKLIALNDEHVHYNKADHSVTYMADGEERTVYIPEAFHDYMKKYKNNVFYVTDNGTPWHPNTVETAAEEGEPSRKAKRQHRDYLEALKKGPNSNVSIIHWRSTNPKQKDLGHTAFSFGRLKLVGESQEDGAPAHLEYEREASETYSFYPTDAPATRPLEHLVRHITAKDKKDSPLQWHIDGAKARMDEHPVAFTAGALARDAATPLGAGLAAGVIASSASRMVDMMREEASPAELRQQIKEMTFGIAAATLAMKGGALLNTSQGVVLKKEESLGSGMLATLISDSQLDLLEHMLYGMYKTFYSEYSLYTSNCADFAGMLADEIGYSAAELMEEVVPDEQPEIPEIAEKWAKRVASKVRDRVMPLSARPDRYSHAASSRDMAHEEIGAVEIDGKTLLAGIMQLSGQSTVLVQLPDVTDRFNDRPIDTFEKLVRSALTLEKQEGNNPYRFALQPHVRIVDPLPPQPGMAL